MLIDEDGGPRAATAPRLSEFLREKLERVLPAHTLKLSIPPHHRPAIAIRIVKTLQRRLSTRAQRAAIYRMIGISLELDGPSITGLSNDAACRRAFATGGRVIGRYAGHCLIRRNQIWNELLHFFGSASQHRSSGGADSQHLEEFASLHASGRGGDCGLGWFLLGAHSASSDTSCSRISL